MSDKVKLPKNVAEAIENCRLDEFSNRVILRLALDERGNSELRDLLYKFAEEKFDTLVSALYIGYEIEQIPEDKVREYYNEYKDEQDIQAGKVIETVLHLLNKSIPGINSPIGGK